MNKPFSNSYVIKETVKHMQNCVQISFKKTVDRMSEFKDDPDKTKEIILTLSNLERLNKLMEEIKENNSQIIGEDK